MTVAHTHACFITASFHEVNWHDVEPLLESWKSLLQGLPGYLGCDVWVRRLENGDVYAIITVTFEHREQLEEFLTCDWAPEKIIGSLDPAAYDLTVDHLVQHI